MTRSSWIRLVVAAALLSAGAPGCTREQPPIATPRESSQAKVQSDLPALAASLESLGLPATDEEPARIARGREELAGLPCQVPDELALLFARVGDGGALGDWQILSPAAAAAVHDSLRQHHDWRPNWIPFARRHTDWLAIESSRGASPAGPVLLVTTGSGEAPHAGLRSTNLTTLAREWAGD